MTGRDELRRCPAAWAHPAIQGKACAPVFAADVDATYDALRSLGARIVEPLEKKLDGNRFYFHCD